jgi:hypothetical protein
MHGMRHVEERRECMKETDTFYDLDADVSTIFK